MTREGRLCPPCLEAWWGWSDYRPPRQVQLISIGYPTGGLKLRSDRWCETVRSQQETILEICAARHVGQLELFAVSA